MRHRITLSVMRKPILETTAVMEIPATAEIRPPAIAEAAIVEAAVVEAAHQM